MQTITDSIILAQYWCISANSNSTEKNLLKIQQKEKIGKKEHKNT